MITLTDDVDLGEVLEMASWNLARLRRNYPGGKKEAEGKTRGEIILAILEEKEEAIDLL